MSSYGDNSIRKIGYVILAILFLSDLAYSFRQHYATPLDGDVVESVLPLPEFEKVLESPLGLNAILDQESYPNPNRFFMHWPMKQFLGNMPIFLQNFFDPIQSVYMSIGIAKTSMQLIIIILLASIINGGFKLQSIDFILCCVILSALFQTHGYRVKIGIIDRSITYAFSYALPLIYLLIFYLPLFIGGVQKKITRPTKLDISSNVSFRHGRLFKWTIKPCDRTRNNHVNSHVSANEHTQKGL